MAQPSHPSSSLVDFVPMIRSPATWTPRPVTLPHDIHPLPDDISAYFVYPYSLENHVLSPQPPHLSHSERIHTLQEQNTARLKFLKDREDKKTRKKREQMRKVAPGWEPEEEDGNGTGGKRRSGILEPTRKGNQQGAAVAATAKSTQDQEAPPAAEPEKPRDVMDDLVEGLAKMDELESSRSVAER